MKYIEITLNSTTTKTVSKTDAYIYYQINKITTNIHVYTICPYLKKVNNMVIKLRHNSFVPCSMLVLTWEVIVFVKFLYKTDTDPGF